MNAATYKNILRKTLDNIRQQQENFGQSLAKLQTSTSIADSEEQLRKIARDTLVLMLNLRQLLQEDRKQIQQAKQHFETTQNESFKTALITKA